MPWSRVTAIAPSPSSCSVDRAACQSQLVKQTLSPPAVGSGKGWVFLRCHHCKPRLGCLLYQVKNRTAGSRWAGRQQCKLVTSAIVSLSQKRLGQLEGSSWSPQTAAVLVNSVHSWLPSTCSQLLRTSPALPWGHCKDSLPNHHRDTQKLVCIKCGFSWMGLSLF